MKMSNGSLDCLPYLASAQSITQRIEDIPHISVKSTFLSGDKASRKNQSGELCRVAAVRQFQMYGIHPESDCDIKVEKSIWGKPILCLSESIERQLKQKRIERLLVSMTNDCDILLCIAAAVQSNKFSNFKPLGIGVDLMHERTASGLFCDCSADVLTQVFFESELKYAADVQDISFYAKSVSVKEAVFKSISEAFHYSAMDSFSKEDIQIASFTEIEVLNISDEWIDTRLHGRLADIAKVLGVKKIYTQFVTGKNYFGAIAVSHG